MNTIDKILDNLVKEVEIYGRSAADCIYLPNLSFTIKDDQFEVPIDADMDGAVVDFDWFMKAADKGYDISHPSPDKSFFLRHFGDDTYAYGSSWNFRELRDNIAKPENWRRCVLFNPRLAPAPCVICYQFLQHEHRTLDVIVTMRSSDVKKVLPQDVLMTWFLLKHVAKDNYLDRGSMTFNIANAHVYYEDCEWQEEFTVDGLD